MTTTFEHGRCPVCRTILSSGLSEPIAEWRCPRCEACLWSLAFPSGTAFYIRRPGQSAAEFLTLLAGPALGASVLDIDVFLRSADSFDIVEFLGELEAASESLGRRRDS
jgi:hypothetical protein